jgi:hypothetical protein
MTKGSFLIICILWLVLTASAATKTHTVVFGRWTTIQPPASGAVGESLRIRSLLVDGKTKEFTTGQVHDVTDRTFVVQRMVRVNDSLPHEIGPTRWRWERAGWVLVDRMTGRVQPVALAEFDSDGSQVSWFRDYAAYCGRSDDGQKEFAIIAQVGKRRPLLKKALGEANLAGCPAPVWQRDPVRVTFAIREDPKLTFSVSSRFVDLTTEDESEGEE